LRSDDEEQLIRTLALQNAVQYGGKAEARAVLGKLLALKPNLRDAAKHLVPTVTALVAEVNAMPLDAQRETLKTLWPTATVDEPRQTEMKQLPPLPNVQRYPLVHVRFAPNPDGPLHLGNSRAVILCDEYAKMYGGRFTLRFDDSDPRTKPPIPEAYDWIRADLAWLDVECHDEVYQSDRLEIYYRYAEQLIEMNAAYVCTCTPASFRRLSLNHRACPCRTLSASANRQRWDRMLDGTSQSGEAVVKIKTDLAHPNPAVRDWSALRIIDAQQFPHPRTGSRYRVWPLFNFCCAVDDHDLQISHILRGKEHLTNMERQRYMYEHLGWAYPDAIHYGRLKIGDVALSKSKTRKGIDDGRYHGWDDPRLGTLKALRRRGFKPAAIRQLILAIGPKPVDVTLSWKNFEALNRKLIDPIADRYAFVADPVTMTVVGVDRCYHYDQPRHPSFPERGRRGIPVTPSHGAVTLLTAADDVKDVPPETLIRLMGLFNVHVESVKGDEVNATFHSEAYVDAKAVGAPLIQWVPVDSSVPTTVVMPDHTIVEGLSEPSSNQLRRGCIVQFERFGFVRIDDVTDRLVAYYAHK
jgi:glutamyl-tRNA synthetase